MLLGAAAASMCFVAVDALSDCRGRLRVRRHSRTASSKRQHRRIIIVATTRCTGHLTQLAPITAHLHLPQGMSFNKLRIFNMTEFKKILFIDADVMVRARAMVIDGTSSPTHLPSLRRVVTCTAACDNLQGACTLHHPFRPSPMHTRRRSSATLTT